MCMDMPIEHLGEHLIEQLTWCVSCHEVLVHDEDGQCGECISTECEYWAEMRDMHARGYSSEDIAQNY